MDGCHCYKYVVNFHTTYAMKNFKGWVFYDVEKIIYEKIAPKIDFKGWMET